MATPPPAGNSRNYLFIRPVYCVLRLLRGPAYPSPAPPQQGFDLPVHAVFSIRHEAYHAARSGGIFAVCMAGSQAIPSGQGGHCHGNCLVFVLSVRGLHRPAGGAAKPAGHQYHGPGIHLAADPVLLYPVPHLSGAGCCTSVCRFSGTNAMATRRRCGRNTVCRTGW